MELAENKLTDFIKSSEKAKWRAINNHNINNFTEDEIKRITNNYSSLIGEGGFGQVYKGHLDDVTPVAVKKYMRQNFIEGFGKEIIVHCQINHKNVVRLLGYCAEENALMIVTEYVSGGNLRDLLHGSDDPISLDARLGIAIECADALGYMHSSMYQPIIHGDIKPDNILLNSKLGVKLSDFGLSRLLSMDKTQYTLNVAGSRGYMDPEYIETGLVDPKSDVYSFGVVLLELITRAKASEHGFSTRLKRNFTDALKKGKQEARKMFDSDISNEGNISILDEIGNLAAECFTKEIKERPEMKDVQERLQMLRRALHCEQAQEKRGQGSSQGIPDPEQKFVKQGTSSNSTVPYYRLNILDRIFNRNASRKQYCFNRNGGPMLQCVSINIFTKREVRKITNNYSTAIGNKYSTAIGDLYSGGAYIGWIDGNIRVLVKDSVNVKVDEAHTDSAHTDSFIAAVVCAHGFRHSNITKLVGCCLETESPIFLYEFDGVGSLYDVLHGNGRRPLSLDSRLKIAIGSAEALAYLHSQSCGNAKFLHGYVTSDNILLAQDFEPKVFNYMTGMVSNWQVVLSWTTYLDPAFGDTGLITQKSDVYGFGALILELITRKPAKYGNNYAYLGEEYISVCKKENSGRAMFDEEIAVEGNIVILEEMGKLAIECLKQDRDERPEMTEVLERLKLLGKAAAAFLFVD